MGLLSKQAQKSIRYLTRPLDFALEIVYPSACLVCGRPTPCLPKAFLSRDLPLKRCSVQNVKSASGSSECVLQTLRTVLSVSRCCKPNEYYFTTVRPLQFYRGVMRALVLQMKRDNSKILGKAIARLYCEERREALEDFHPDCIVAVPMNWRRLFLRGGVNAPDVIAKKMAEELRIPCLSKYVKRVRSTATQTSIKWDERLINVYDAFEIREFNLRYRLFLKKAIKRVLKNTWSLFPDARKKFRPIERTLERFIKDKLLKKDSVFKNKKVIVLDDAFTTGSTVNEIARILLNAGASEVMVATIARAGLGKKKKPANVKSRAGKTTSSL